MDFVLGTAACIVLLGIIYILYDVIKMATNNMDQNDTRSNVWDRRF